MVPLARAFRDGGDQVAWATGIAVCADLAEEGFEAMPAGLDAERSRREFLDRFPEYGSLSPAEGPAFMFSRLFGTVRTPRMLDDLLGIVRDWRPDLIVHDAAEFAAPIAAAVADVPCVTHSYGALTLAERVEEASREVAYLWEANGLEPRPYAGNYEYLYLDIYPETLRSGARDQVRLGQPLRPEGFALAGSELLPSWAAAVASAPLVYVTLGTVFNQNLTVFQNVIAGLTDLPVRLLVTVGPAGDPAALGPQPPNVHVARYIRQSDVLPSCAAVVSHAGSGTFLAALAAGLPQLCLPQAADQFGNASACSHAGAGLQLQPDQITAPNVRNAARQLFSDDAFGKSARRVANEIAHMPTPETVANNIRNL